MKRDDWLALLVAGMTFGGLCLFLEASARAQDHTQGHAKYHDFYREWHQPGTGYSCCNARINYPDGHFVGDCYPTEFRPNPSGRTAWIAKLAPEDVKNRQAIFSFLHGQSAPGEWIEVPDAKIIREHNPDETGRDGHLCVNQMVEVLCAVPPFGAL